MTILQAAGAAIVIGVTLALLKDGGGRLALFVGAGGGILLLGYMMARLGGVFRDFTTLARESALSPYVTLLLKAIGIGYVVSISADICRDLGATETAKKLELCGRAELLVLALPPLTELLKLACNMAEGV